jgi:hypothetical protein
MLATAEDFYDHHRRNYRGQSIPATTLRTHQSTGKINTRAAVHSANFNKAHLSDTHAPSSTYRTCSSAINVDTVLSDPLKPAFTAATQELFENTRSAHISVTAVRLAMSVCRFICGHKFLIAGIRVRAHRSQAPNGANATLR